METMTKDTLDLLLPRDLMQDYEECAYEYFRNSSEGKEKLKKVVLTAFGRLTDEEKDQVRKALDDIRNE